MASDIWDSLYTFIQYSTWFVTEASSLENMEICYYGEYHAALIESFRQFRALNMHYFSNHYN